MNFLHKKVLADILRKNGDSFSLNDVVSFTVINDGDSDALLSYRGEATLMRIPKGTARDFPGDSGYVYFGEMQIAFEGTNMGSVEVIKSVASTTER
jgi:hypothetical protein